MADASRERLDAPSAITDSALLDSGELECPAFDAPCSPLGINEESVAPLERHHDGAAVYLRLLPARRLADRMAALALLPVAAPLMACIALAIRVENTGSVLFPQERLGYGGSRFRALKFRTMHVDADRQLERLLESDTAARIEYETYRKLRRDPRLTRVGRLLRRYSLDEIPQILNILAGDMSFVGPRPYLPRELATMGDSAKVILNAVPGLTGLWQVSGRNALSFKRRLELDVAYVESYSIGLDLRILLRTFRVVWTGYGAA